jgi:hypothetical protein
MPARDCSEYRLWAMTDGKSVTVHLVSLGASAGCARLFLGVVYERDDFASCVGIWPDLPPTAGSRPRTH